MLLLPKSKVLRINSCHYGVIFTASMNSLLPKSSITATAHTRSHSFHSCSSSSSQNPIFHLRSGNNRVHFATPKFVPSIYQKVSGCSSSLTPAMPIPRPINGVDFVVPDPQIGDQNQLVQLRRKLQMNGIDIHTPGQYNALLCPRCKGGDSGEKSFSLMISKDGGLAAWNCFRGKCGWKGQINASADVKSTYASMNKVIKTKQPPRIIAEESLELEPLGDEVLKYFAERLISSETLQRNAVRQKKIVGQITIAFTYRRNGNLVNCKYRDLSKTFWEDADAEKIFYGMDDIQEASDIIIVEDEIDKLSIDEVGFRNCVSVPDGAPSKVLNKEFPLEEEDTNYHYLRNCEDYTAKASRIILATNGNPRGQALAEELARRLGKERCWRVKWPKKNDTESFGDANEVLMYKGPHALREAIEKAEVYPITGLFNFSHYFDEIDAYYHQSLGFELGLSTGWKALDELYNVVPGELTIVTGVPNSGKSEWIDALLCNLNRSVQWKFALCSMENKVREHARKLLEKHIRKPFFDVRYADSTERMSSEELELGKKWLSDSFYLIRCENDVLPSINWILNLARTAVLRHGIQGLVIDPYNELDHQRSPSQTETEYVSQMLSKIKRFAQHHSCHVWFVAHPRQLQHWVGDAPNLYDISGSAHFINKCDNGIVIHRNRDPNAGPLDLVQVCVRKVRNKVAGTIGDAFLSYNRVTGEYEDIDDEPGPYKKSESWPQGRRRR